MLTEEIKEIFQRFFDNEDCYTYKFIEALRKSLYAIEKIDTIVDIIDCSENCETHYGIREFSKESAYEAIVRTLEGE